MKVIDEGVETLEQGTLLKTRDCDNIKGFYFSKPLPSNDINEILINSHHIFQ
jgi:EAL domain-containing protein (putative c-di-GMP-specific phosphodiesterase class I)